jgi:glycine/D-amino acid oxidase-like deaminating enzyme
MPLCCLNLNRIRAKLGVVIAAGTWTGPLLAAATGTPSWQRMFQPRRGHLLVLPPPEGMARVNHGIMELAYTKHYSRSSRHHEQKIAPVVSPGTSSEDEVDVTFTATTSMDGTLLLGKRGGYCALHCVVDRKGRDKRLSHDHLTKVSKLYSWSSLHVQSQAMAALLMLGVVIDLCCGCR